MFLRVACLLLALSAVSAQAPARSIKLKFKKIDTEDLTGKILNVACTFDESLANFNSVTQMKLFYSDLGGSEPQTLVARISSDGIWSSEDENVQVIGSLTNPTNHVAKLDATWVSPNEGFCRSYTCTAIGEDLFGDLQAMTKTIKVRSANGEGCRNKEEENNEEEVSAELEEKVQQCSKDAVDIESNGLEIVKLTEDLIQVPDILESVKMLGDEFQALQEQVKQLTSAPQTIQENSDNILNLKEQVESLSSAIEEGEKMNTDEFAKAQTGLSNAVKMQEEEEEILRRILSIDQSKYDVSSLYKNQIYIASKGVHDFDLHDTNEECKTNGGYLVEFDGEEEQTFVKDFIKPFGNYAYHTGGNDVENEGNFVYYTSKKPVINVQWKSGEPNNSGGNEDCLEIQQGGLNDKKCDGNFRHICEIPLF